MSDDIYLFTSTSGATWAARAPNPTEAERRLTDETAESDGEHTFELRCSLTASLDAGDGVALLEDAR